MKVTALLLTSLEPSAEIRNVAKVLDFFGVPSLSVTVAELIHANRPDGEAASRYRLFGTADLFADLVAGLPDGQDGNQWWRDRVHSAFVFTGESTATLERLIRAMTGDPNITVRVATGQTRSFQVSADPKAISAVMAGVSVAGADAELDLAVIEHAGHPAISDVVTLGPAAAFVKVAYRDTPVFVSTSRRVIDIDAELAMGLFDLREHAPQALPLVLYLRWAFGKAAWHTPEANACLIIDDPLLCPRYGHVNFPQLAELMRRHRFSTNVAFIPWNWRRTSPAAARLFGNEGAGFSVSIHGCDHTRAEFGGQDRDWIHHKASQALERMTRHESRTGIAHDRVMVFPQGVFSATAMSVLKRTGLIAAVNNDTLSTDPQPRPISVAEVWDVAVMGYDNFPLFTRRYPWDGCENFAFDLLLGKPCLAVIHHDYCQDQGRRLVALVEQLNALNCPLTWRSLGEVVLRGCRQRETLPDVTDVEMYGTELRLENPSPRTRRFNVRRRESAASAVKEVQADAATLAWRCADGYLQFELQLPPGAIVVIRVKFHCYAGSRCPSEGLQYRFKTGLRRYLSEARDNYVIRFAPRFLSRLIRVN